MTTSIKLTAWHPVACIEPPFVGFMICRTSLGTPLLESVAYPRVAAHPTSATWFLPFAEIRGCGGRRLGYIRLILRGPCSWKLARWVTTDPRTVLTLRPVHGYFTVLNQALQCMRRRLRHNKLNWSVIVTQTDMMHTAPSGDRQTPHYAVTSRIQVWFKQWLVDGAWGYSSGGGRVTINVFTIQLSSHMVIRVLNYSLQFTSSRMHVKYWKTVCHSLGAQSTFFFGGGGLQDIFLPEIYVWKI